MIFESVNCPKKVEMNTNNQFYTFDLQYRRMIKNFYQVYIIHTW